MAISTDSLGQLREFLLGLFAAGGLAWLLVCLRFHPSRARPAYADAAMCSLYLISGLAGLVGILTVLLLGRTRAQPLPILQVLGAAATVLAGGLASAGVLLLLGPLRRVLPAHTCANCGYQLESGGGPCAECGAPAGAPPRCRWSGAACASLALAAGCLALLFATFVSLAIGYENVAAQEVGRSRVFPPVTFGRAVEVRYQASSVVRHSILRAARGRPERRVSETVTIVIADASATNPATFTRRGKTFWPAGTPDAPRSWTVPEFAAAIQQQLGWDAFEAETLARQTLGDLRPDSMNAQFGARLDGRRWTLRGLAEMGVVLGGSLLLGLVSAVLLYRSAWRTLVTGPGSHECRDQSSVADKPLRDP